jgi:predicted transcriptional regulator of viral defense system
MQSVPLHTRIARVARGQHGLLTRAQLAVLGVSGKQVRAWTASGRLERVTPGVVRVAGVPKTRDQLLRAATLWGGVHALASHRSAGELWGFDGVKAANQPEITMPAKELKQSADIVVHSTRAAVTDRRVRRGVPTTSPERTLIDLAGSLRPEQLEIAFESARRERHVTTASLERALARVGAKGRRGGEALQQLLATLANEPPCESALEVLTARMLRATDLPKPQRQVPVTAFDRDYRLDFAWPSERVALECDGRKWHEIESDFERDRQRWSAITAATGYRIV